MKEKRTNRIASEIKKVISELILFELKDPRVGNMTSITDVELTSDLSFATIYLSVLGSDEEKNEAIKGMENAKGFMKKELGKKLDLRHIPELIFKLDNSVEQGLHIDELLKQINKNERYE